MKNSKPTQLFLAFSLICLLAMISCRKKEERYEGVYLGTERHTIQDSGEVSFSVDTTYTQEFQVTYSKKIYTISKVNNNAESGVSTISKDMIVAGEANTFGEVYTDAEGNEIAVGGYMKFVGDSMYFESANSINWETESFVFKGKRN